MRETGTGQQVAQLHERLMMMMLLLVVVCFLLSDSPASEFYMPTFRNTLFHLHRPGPFTACFCTLTRPHSVTLMAQAISETNLFPYNNPNMPPAVFILQAPTCLWRWNRQSVPKRRHIKFRRRGITQMKAYNIQNTAKVWNQEICICFLCQEVFNFYS